MKNRIFLGLLLVAALDASVLGAPALAADLHTLSMAGHGEVKAAPDMVTVNAGVTTSAATAAVALAANTARMKGVFGALEKLGVPDKNIQTANFSVSPQYTNGDNNGPRRLTGYQVNNEVSLRLEDVTKLGTALDALVTAGANQMNGISFDIRQPAPLLEQARAGAIADARARAETYARAAGVTLGPILSISEGANEGPRPMYRMAAAFAAAPPPPIAVGEQSVSADVSVVWEIH
ncbi:MAG TPA: SIMPL domain-containing protein [Rhizomicrobium sp.]|nr:SIMPL domain-containing protein [Rhizomicrobium sp.]